MAVIDYRLVYRDGAVVGAPVNSLKVCDLVSEFELIPGNFGDLVYDKQFSTLRFFDGINWRVLVTHDLYYPFTGDIKTTGKIYERGRSVAMGDWIDVPYDSNNYWANGGTWTVGSNGAHYSYTLIGSTMIINLRVHDSTLTIPDNTQTGLYIRLPPGFTAGHSKLASAFISFTGGPPFEPASFRVDYGNYYITITRNIGYTYLQSGAVMLYGQISISLL